MDQPGHDEGIDHKQIINYCTFHPSVETGLSCSKCSRHICTRCMIQAPVGIRCSECADVQKVPTLDVQRTYYVRAGIAGAGAGIIMGLVWSLIVALLSFTPLAWLLAIAAGHAVGESVSIATNRKRGTGLMVVSGASLLTSLIIAGVIEPDIFGAFFGQMMGIIFLGLAFYIAVNKVR